MGLLDYGYGTNGFKELGNGETTVTKSIFMVVFYETGTITATSKTGDSLVDLPVLAGGVVYGPFSEVTVSTGRALAYYTSKQQ